ncbi:hypothetical protein [Solimonas sp. SE-A11]|uniref:HvfA family oxazolone/thioamide-modified RiPP metallophore n=1 Tax=Solimonas sp. SE-A11 TaxID=3054954 RepID=UPI00259D097B|nr:hypothetical protein [Solimonas sp. SE-A11]MDM4768707.1 hypothetical protein [Solimonas sp. SE-A11]
MRQSKKPLAIALGAAFAMTGMAAQASVFKTTDLSGGYMQLADAKAGEGKCGEGKCGEGKCGAKAGEKKAEGKCGEKKDADKKAHEGKCGEGKCGEKKAK